MAHRKIVLVLALAVAAAVPATASAAPTVTVTGDDGNPATLSATAPLGIRNMDVTVTVAVPGTDTASYTAQVVAPDDVAAAPALSCTDPDALASRTLFADYRGNGPYTVVVRYHRGANCTGTVSERRFQYVVNAGTAVTPPPTRVLTRPPNSLVTDDARDRRRAQPGAFGYEIRYALGGVVGPDGAISGPSAEAFLDTTTGLADFRFHQPGRYVIVARAGHGAASSPRGAARSTSTPSRRSTSSA